MPDFRTDGLFRVRGVQGRPLILAVRGFTDEEGRVLVGVRDIVVLDSEDGKELLTLACASLPCGVSEAGVVFFQRPASWLENLVHAVRLFFS